VAVLGSTGYSEGMGKKGTSTDITFYNLKKGEATITFIEPSRYPERLSSLFYAVSASREAILVVDEIAQSFGEMVLMLNCAGVRKGYLVPRKFIPVERIQSLVKGTVIESYEVVEDDKNWLRERLLGEAEGIARDPSTAAAQGGSVVVDHSFNVKGVGTVILGSVVRGTVSVHETMNALPQGKNALIRSIQKHDDDFGTASAGDRVGLALKDIEVDDVERGTVLTTESGLKSSLSIEAEAELVKYWGTPLKPGMVVHVGHWMQFLPARIEGVDDGSDWRKPRLRISLEKALVYPPGSRAVIAYLEGSKLRVVGTLNLP
jgi:selenocysteine-specific translation elongation factor